METPRGDLAYDSIGVDSLHGCWRSALKVFSEMVHSKKSPLLRSVRREGKLPALFVQTL